MATDSSATTTSKRESFFDTTLDFSASTVSGHNPMLAIPGTADANSTTQANKKVYEAAFPYKDGTSEETRLPPPLDEAGNPIDLQTVELADITPDLFSQNFHTGHQLELLNRFGGNLVLEDGAERLDVLLGADGRTVLVLQQLIKNDIGQLSLDNQILIANYLARSDVPASVKEQLAFAWEVTVGDTPENNRAAAAAIVDEAIETIVNAGSNHDDLYIEQLEILKSLLDKNALISTASLRAQIGEIKERFDRMHAFEAIEAQTAINQSPDLLFTGFNSQDGNATLLSGLRVFLEREQRYVEIQKQRLSVAATASTIDLATMVAVLQMIYNVKQESEVAVLTEELQQQNALLKDYAEMQRIVNEVLKSFSSGSDAEKEKRNAAGLEGDTFFYISDPQFPLSDDELRAVLMFDAFTSGPAHDGLAHPLEGLRGITRPLAQLLSALEQTALSGEITGIGLKNLDQSDWNLFSTQLADAVTLINQQSQILTNDISSFNQQQNRHFDLANNSLRRMMDLINAISRIS